MAKTAKKRPLAESLSPHTGFMPPRTSTCSPLSNSSSQPSTPYFALQRGGGEGSEDDLSDRSSKRRRKENTQPTFGADDGSSRRPQASANAIFTQSRLQPADLAISPQYPHNGNNTMAMLQTASEQIAAAMPRHPSPHPQQQQQPQRYATLLPQPPAMLPMPYKPMPSPLQNQGTQQTWAPQHGYHIPSPPKGYYKSQVQTQPHAMSNSTDSNIVFQPLMPPGFIQTTGQNPFSSHHHHPHQQSGPTPSPPPTRRPNAPVEHGRQTPVPTPAMTYANYLSMPALSYPQFDNNNNNNTLVPPLKTDKRKRAQNTAKTRGKSNKQM